MSSGRAITFIILSSTILLGAMLLQNLYGPKPDVPVAENSETTATLSEEDPAASENTTPNADTQSPNAVINGTEQAEETSDSNSKDGQEDKTPTAPPAPAFVKLGSLNPDGSDRFLVTVNQNGGTLHQVELLSLIHI